MKKVLILTLLCVIAQLLSVTVDGYAYLEGETDHSGIEVFFQRVVPDTLFSDTVYTNSTGSFSSVVESGWYDVSYSKSGFLSTDSMDVSLYTDQTLPSKTLFLSNPNPYEISGSIDGILSAGEYTVISTITVVEGDSLIFEPGVILNFNTDLDFIIDGYLNAVGTVTDSIIFNNCKTLKFNSSPLAGMADISLNYCSIRNLSGSNIFINPPRDSEPESGSELSESVTSINILNTYLKVNNIGLSGHNNINFDSSVIEGMSTNSCLTFGLMFGSKVRLDNCTLTSEGKGIFLYEVAHSTHLCSLNNSFIYSKNIGIEAWVESDIIINNSILISEENTAVRTSSSSGICDINNSTIISRNGAAIANSGYTYTVTNTIASGDVYGVEKYSYGDGTFDIQYSNVQGQSNNFYNCGSYLGVIVTTNLNEDPCDAYGNISMVPQFVSVGANDFRLAKTSPCRDAGNNSYTTEEWDIRGNGFSRKLDEAGNSGIVDIGAYEWNLNSDPMTGIENSEARISSYTLNQNYPNPFNPETTISYSLMNNAKVILKVYDIAGREVCNLVDKKQNKGLHEVNFDGSMLTSGIYFYRLSVNGKAIENRKMMLLK